MNMWCHLPTSIKRRHVLRFAVLASMVVALTTTLMFAYVAHAAPSTNKTISFNGRLLTASGAVVPDGHYNIQFKLYEGGDGTEAGNPGGTLAWTEDYLNGGSDNGVEVRNGFFSVDLGSRTPFGSSVDWNQDAIFLSMNVAGSAAGCSTFDTAPCTADGEMLPMRRITATPYAINAGQLGGKTADQYLQLAQGVQTDASNNTSSIFVNKTGTGNIMQLQSGATDVFTIGNAGDLSLGNNANKSISIATSEADTAGRDLTVSAGTGGSGSGADGGTLTLQGGDAGGTNGNGGDITIDAGAGTGSGSGGEIAIGAANASDITIGATDQATTQNISIGANDTSGGSSNVTVGSGGGADSGSTTIQAKNNVTIKTNGTTRATFSDSSSTVYFGNGVSSSAPDDATLQGTNSSATGVAGGSLTIQGGNATTGDANGGNVTLSGGAGSGNGAQGLVVMTTPTFSTVENDANCYAGGANVAASCTISATTVNNASAVIVGFSAAGQTATLPDPANTTAGRIIYVMASGTTQDFTLKANAGGEAEQNVLMKKNTTTTLIWNGGDWTVAGGSGVTTLQNTYDNTPQAAGGDELVLSGATGGLTVRDSSTDPVDDTLLEIKNASGESLLSVNKKTTSGSNLASDGGVATGTGWAAAGGATVSRVTTDGQAGSDSAQVEAGTGVNSGVTNTLASAPAINSTYKVSVYGKLVSGDAFTDFEVLYSPDGGSNFVACTSYNTQTITSGDWTNITCDIATGATAATNPQLYIVQPTAPSQARTFLVDSLSFTKAPSTTQNVKVGGNQSGESNDPTIFTLDKAASAPASNDDALLGSMYYDTSLGKVQCYEEEGWGACGAAPDTFVTISPEYTNAVMNGQDIGTITSDLCSDTLNINDGSSDQPTICGTNETYNFYKWTSAEESDQTRSIFVTYQLPANFKEFVPETTSLMGRTDSGDAKVEYQVYRDNGEGLASCGSAVSVSTGAQSSWQKATATGSADPADCNFEAGDSLFIRINLTAKNDANAFVSNLGFTFSNN